jgi:hypothetical protein
VRNPVYRGSRGYNDDDESSSDDSKSESWVFGRQRFIYQCKSEAQIQDTTKKQTKRQSRVRLTNIRRFRLIYMA